MIDRFEQVGVTATQRLVLELEVLGERQHDLLSALAGDLVVPVHDFGGDGDRRQRGRVDVARQPAEHVLRRRVDEATSRAPRRHDGDAGQCDGREQRAAAGERRAPSRR